MNGRTVPKEGIPIPAEIVDGWLRGLSQAEIQVIIDCWRSRGLSQAEILRAMSICNDACTLWADDDPISSVFSPVLDLQRQVGKELVDWTWAEALEVFIEARRQDLDEAVDLGRKFEEIDPKRETEIRQILRILVTDDGDPITTSDVDLELAKRQILKVLRRAHVVHDEWLELRRSGLSGGIALSYRASVSGYYQGEQDMREKTTPRARRAAKNLEIELDKDHSAIELRKELHIPNDGFHDVAQAASWLYDRRPPIKDLASLGSKDLVWTHGDGGPYLYDPAILQVSVFAEATRRLRQNHEEKYELSRDWDVVLCFYLLRGKLDPPPRKRRPRKRPKREKHEQIYELSKKYRHAFKVALSYICGLTDADWAEIREKRPAARLDRMSQDEMLRIVEEALKIADGKGTLRPREEWIQVAYVRTARSRMRAEGKM